MKLIDYFLLFVPDGVRNIFKYLRRMEHLVGKSSKLVNHNCVYIVVTTTLCTE